MLGLATGMLGGGVTSGVLAWILSGIVGWIPAEVVPYIVVVTALGAVLRDLGVVRFPLPERRTLVPKSVLYKAPPWAATRFGFELGLGFRTALSASAPYLLLVALLLYGGPLWLLLMAGAAFGFGRFAMPAARYFRAEGDDWDALIDARSGLVRSSSTAVAAIGAIVLMVLA